MAIERVRRTFPGFRLPNSFKLDRDTVGVFAEMQARPLAGLTLLGSVRHDDRTARTPRRPAVGAVYAPREGTTELRANWGQGFKLPSFFSLGSPLVGNPDLRPETSDSFDVGFSRSVAAGRARLGLTYFDNRFEDLIDFDPELFLQVNRKDVQTSGVEFEGTFEPGAALGLRAHVTRRLRHPVRRIRCASARNGVAGSTFRGGRARRSASRSHGCTLARPTILRCPRAASS
jgi:iron complex outermembrane receptor protein/vitamin B12 transporter